MKKVTRFFTLLIILTITFSMMCTAQGYRERRDQPEKLMDIVGVKPGMIVGEAGAGDGYLSFHLSRRVGNEGRVYANDINRRALQSLDKRREREGVTNITTVIGEIADPLYPVKDLDMILMIYAFHDFTEQEEWLRNAKKYLKPTASIVIFDREDSHTNLSKEYVSSLGENAGYKLTHYENFHSGLYIFILQMK
ncbi:class I SAM-dependent methyltransferase [Acidobacteriota bacterium]